MRNSELDFSKVIDLSSELLCVHEPDGRYKYLNQRIESLAGYQASELVGKDPYQFFHPDDLEEINKNHESSFGGEPPTIEYRFKTKDGSYIWLQTKTTAISNSQGEVTELLTSSHDISKLKELISQNQKSQELLQHAAKMARFGAWEVNLETMTPYWDQTTREIHEVDPDYMPDLETAINFYAEEVRDFVNEHVNNAINHHKEFDFVLPLVTAKGNRKWVRSKAHPKTKAGKTIKLYGVFQDVTDDKLHNLKLTQMATMLRQQKEQLQDFNQVISHHIRGPLTNLNLINNMISKNGRQLNDDLVNGLEDSVGKLNQLISDFEKASNLIDGDEHNYQEVDLEKVMSHITEEMAELLNKCEAQLFTDLSAWQTLHYPEENLRFYLGHLMENSCKFSSPERPLKIEVTTRVQDGHRQLIVQDNGIGIDLKRVGNRMFKLYKTFHKGYEGRGHGLFSIRSMINAQGGEIFVESEPDRGCRFIIDFDYLDTNAEFEERIKKAKGSTSYFQQND